jgi:SAM-dependent MidA family methyltransferase
VIEFIRERGPLTVAAFMDLALYHPEFGYYARAPQRSGRAGDFFTSVDVGAVFGELLEGQLAEMAAILDSRIPPPPCHFDLVEAGAGNGRLSADILRAARRRDPAFFESIQLHLVEASPTARAVHRETLADVADRLATSGSSLPESFQGVLFANELLDALATHQVVMRDDGLREVYVDVAHRRRPVRDMRDHQASAAGVGAIGADDRLTLVEGPLSTPRLAEYLDHLAITLEPGWRVEINLRAIDWIREASRRLQRGFMILIDYGHRARELYSPSHAAGTLTTFARHQTSGPQSSADAAPWLQQPGERDITAHVDFTSVQRAAEDAGLATLGFLDQTYFLLGIVERLGFPGDPDDLKRRLAVKTLLLPGGLGSTHKVLILGKGVGTPSLVGCSSGGRAT